MKKILHLLLTSVLIMCTQNSQAMRQQQRKRISMRPSEYLAYVKYCERVHQKKMAIKKLEAQGYKGEHPYVWMFKRMVAKIKSIPTCLKNKFMAFLMKRMMKKMQQQAQRIAEEMKEESLKHRQRVSAQSQKTIDNLLKESKILREALEEEDYDGDDEDDEDDDIGLAFPDGFLEQANQAAQNPQMMQQAMQIMQDPQAMNQMLQALPPELMNMFGDLGMRT